jgi:hypothetical protein
MIVSAILSVAISAFTLRIGWHIRRDGGTVTAGRISIGTMALIGALVSGIMGTLFGWAMNRWLAARKQ